MNMPTSIFHIVDALECGPNIRSKSNYVIDFHFFEAALELIPIRHQIGSFGILFFGVAVEMKPINYIGKTKLT